MNFSKERIRFYEEVRAFHKESGIDSRFHRSALEGYVKACGGSAWDVTDEDHHEYSLWRKGTEKKFSIPK